MANIAQSLIDDLERMAMESWGSSGGLTHPSRYLIFYENEIIWSR